MENNDTMFLGIMITAAIIIVWAMILNWRDSIKLNKAKKKKEQEDSKRTFKWFDERTELQEWLDKNVQPRAEGESNTAKFILKKIEYKEVKERYPLYSEEELNDADFDYESSGNRALITIALNKLLLIHIEDDKGEETNHFDLIVGTFNLNIEDREDGTEEITISMKEEDQEEAPKKRSRRISQKVKDLVWNRDGGECVECGSNENLEFDHIIPHSKGGANTYRNIQLLCEPCNRSKSAKIG